MPIDQPRYTDYYNLLSYIDFLALVAAGTLSNFLISLGEDNP